MKEKTNVGFSIFPNPVSSHFTVTGNYSGSATIEIVSLSGRKVMQIQVQMNEKMVIDKNLIQSGIYLVYLKNDKYEVIGTHKINVL